MPTIKIVCCGNLLRGDDGVGIHLYKELSRLPLPKNIQAIDAGTGCFRIFGLLDGCSKLIFIDAMKGKSLGKVHRLTESDLEIGEITFTLHDFKLEHLIKEITYTFENKPEIVVFGIEVEETDNYSMELTSPVKKAIPTIIELVLKEIEKDSIFQIM